MIDRVFGYVLTGVFFVLGLVMLLRPQWVVRSQARFYRTAYKDVWRKEDQEINKGWQTPWDRVLMGPRAEFVKRGAEHPEEFPGLMAAARVIGGVMVGMIVFAFLCVLFFTLTSGAQ